MPAMKKRMKKKSSMMMNPTRLKRKNRSGSPS
jgi:hypothetical protein